MHRLIVINVTCTNRYLFLIVLGVGSLDQGPALLDSNEGFVPGL